MKHVPNIHVVRGDICEQVVDAIVNPANRAGLMGGGVANAIKMVGGYAIEEEAKGKAPIEIGSAVMTSAGSLEASHVIHAPTMNKVSEDSNINWIKKAVVAALDLADESLLKSIAFPGMGTGIGGIHYDDAARVMVEIISTYQAEVLEDVYLVAISEELAKAFDEEVSKL